jgi:TrmH family RNA methyltransferase
MDRITSTQNERVRQAVLLQRNARARRKAGLMVLEGVRLIGDALARGLAPQVIFYDADVLEETAFPVGASPALAAVTPEVMRYLSATETPPGALAVFPIQPPPIPDPLTSVLVLDALRDPGNLGTILRAAAAAGVDLVLLAPGCADAYNPKVLRAGMGAHVRLPVLEASWTRIAIITAGMHMLLADMQGDASYDAVDWREPWALIIGSEAHGESEQAAQLAQQRVFVPMAAETESLNAAVAAAIMLFEAARQRRPVP